MNPNSGIGIFARRPQHPHASIVRVKTMFSRRSFIYPQSLSSLTSLIIDISTSIQREQRGEKEEGVVDGGGRGRSDGCIDSNAAAPLLLVSDGGEWIPTERNRKRRGGRSAWGRKKPPGSLPACEIQDGGEDRRR